MCELLRRQSLLIIFSVTRIECEISELFQKNEKCKRKKNNNMEIRCEAHHHTRANINYNEMGVNE